MALGSHDGISPVVFPAAGVSAVSFVTTDSAALGHRKLGDRLVVDGEEYVFVHNAMSSAATQGVALTISAVSGYSLTRSTLAGADIVIGFNKHQEIPAGGYAWAMTRGLVAPNNVSAICAGVLIAVGLNGVVQTYATATSFDPGILGKMVVSSVSSTGGGLAYVKCMG